MENNKKTIAITAIGSWGDVLPYIVLANDLHKKGYHVVVGAAKRYEEQILKQGWFTLQKKKQIIEHSNIRVRLLTKLFFYIIYQPT